MSWLAAAGRPAPSGCWGWALGSPSQSGSATAARPRSASSAPSTRSPPARRGPRVSWPWVCARCAAGRSPRQPGATASRQYRPTSWPDQRSICQQRDPPSGGSRLPYRPMLMLLASLPPRAATAIRLLGLVLIALTVLNGSPHPGTSGRALVVSVLLAAAVVSWLIWMIRPLGDRVTIELYVMAAAGRLLVGASTHGAASAFVFVAVVAAGLRAELPQAAPVALVGTLAVAISDLLYNGSALGLLAYALGFAASLLAAANARGRTERTEQAELLLAQTQRSHEDQLRAARLEESTRIAREIHDVLAHTLAGLTIQLEATRALIDQGADRTEVLARVQRAHELAKEGLRETRLAVGALRGDAVSAPAAVEALVAEYRAGSDASAELTIDGDRNRLAGP